MIGPNTSNTSLILASASPRRREILTGLGVDFKVDPSTIVEPERKTGESPARYAVRLARAKVLEVSRRYDSSFVLGGDTVVVLRNRLLGKPEGKDDARRMLQMLSAGWHEVVTGICLRDCRTRRTGSSHTTSRIHFRRLSDPEIDWYLETGEYRDKAGAYGIQGYASLFVDRIEGCYFNIVGMPVSAFERLCRRMNLPLRQMLGRK